MTTVTPKPIGTYPSLIGVPLRADVTLRKDEQFAGFEIELVEGRKGGRSRAWDSPRWRMTSAQPQYAWLDDRRAFDGLRIARRRPLVRMQTASPIEAYSWMLHQDGEILEEGTRVADGIAADGLSFEFRPERRLRRSGRAGKPRLKGVFYPPFDSHLPGMPRSEASRISYAALTHPGHDDQDAYAVDFNWGSGGADRGHWVRAAANGRVRKVDRANGQVHIEHPKFDGETDWETVYAHLDPVLVKPGQRVKAQQRIGNIGSQYHGSGAISPHLHHQQRKDGVPLKMRLLVEGQEVPIGVSRPNPSRTVQWDRQVPGWLRPRGPAPARLVVRVRDAADGRWSERNDLRFVLAPKDDPALDEQAGAFGTVDADTDIAFDYNGPEVEPGEYTFRYRAIGDSGRPTPWAYDRSVIVQPALA
jgi:hypothetical protein